MGPDPAIGGGMAASERALLESPLAARYRLEVVPTYRGPERLRGALVFAGALGRLALWSLRGHGRVVHIHATVRGSSYRKATCVVMAKMLRRRVVLQVHSCAGDIAAFVGSRGRISRVFLRRAFCSADRVLTVSVASAEALERVYGLAGIVVVPNPAPAVAAFSRPALGPADPVHAVYLGGFANPAKGGDVMVAAAELAVAREPRLRLSMAGPGELPGSAAALVAASDAVVWEGWVGPERKDALLREGEIFVMSSRSEGLPMALLEAMAYGMAIATTAVGGIGEVVDSEETAILVPSEDAEALADALCRLAAGPELRGRLAAAAKDRAEALDADAVAGRLTEIYEALG
jgi:glycosyltransferase involved in cell wall biosynthesis